MNILVLLHIYNNVWEYNNNHQQTTFMHTWSTMSIQVWCTRHSVLSVVWPWTRKATPSEWDHPQWLWYRLHILPLFSIVPHHNHTANQEVNTWSTSATRPPLYRDHTALSTKHIQSPNHPLGILRHNRCQCNSYVSVNSISINLCIVQGPLPPLHWGGLGHGVKGQRGGGRITLHIYIGRLDNTLPCTSQVVPRYIPAVLHTPSQLAQTRPPTVLC